MSIPLHELNAHLLARLLPETHGGEVLEAVKETAKAAGKKAGKAAKAAAAEIVEKVVEYTAEQLEILAAAGIADVTAADPQAVAAILGLPQQ